MTTTAVLLLGLAGWLPGWWVLLGEEQQRLGAERRRLQAQIRIAEAEAEVLHAAGRPGLDRAQAQVAGLKRRLAERAGELVEPEQMAALLERTLSANGELRFVSLEGLGASPVRPDVPAAHVSAGPDPRDDGASVHVYRHGLRLVFAGDHQDVLAYLRALQALPGVFFWESIELEIEDYPETTGTITLYTLGVDQAWLRS